MNDIPPDPPDPFGKGRPKPQPQAERRIRELLDQVEDRINRDQGGEDDPVESRRAFAQLMLDLNMLFSEEGIDTSVADAFWRERL